MPPVSYGITWFLISQTLLECPSRLLVHSGRLTVLASCGSLCSCHSEWLFQQFPHILVPLSPLSYLFVRVLTLDEWDCVCLLAFFLGCRYSWTHCVHSVIRLILLQIQDWNDFTLSTTCQLCLERDDWHFLLMIVWNPVYFRPLAPMCSLAFHIVTYFSFLRNGKSPENCPRFPN